VEEQSLFAYDQERQINNPNRVDPFTGATRGMFRRFQLEYQTDITPVNWLTSRRNLLQPRQCLPRSDLKRCS